MEQQLRRPFRHHDNIDKWIMQYHGCTAQTRFKALLLRGDTRSGKTQKACSLYGLTRTLVVNAEGLGKNLPPLSHLDRSETDCVVLHEGSHLQVLHNKLFFQAGAHPVKLWQSPCNQCSHSCFIYKFPMIITSSFFPMSVEEGVSQEEADWLQANIIDVPVPVGGKWWIDMGQDEIDLA